MYQEWISCYLPKRPWTIVQVTSVHQDSNECSEIQQSSVGHFLILVFLENNNTHVPSTAALSPLLENLLSVTYHKLYQNFLAEPVMQLWWLISLFNHKISLLYLREAVFCIYASNISSRRPTSFCTVFDKGKHFCVYALNILIGCFQLTEYYIFSHVEDVTMCTIPYVIFNEGKIK